MRSSFWDYLNIIQTSQTLISTHSPTNTRTERGTYPRTVINNNSASLMEKMMSTTTLPFPTTTLGYRHCWMSMSCPPSPINITSSSPKMKKTKAASTFRVGGNMGPKELSMPKDIAILDTVNKEALTMSRGYEASSKSMTQSCNGARSLLATNMNK